MATVRNHLSTIRGEITNQGLNVSDGDIYSGPLNENMPKDNISMSITEGEPETSFLGSNQEVIQRAGAQVLLRGKPENYDNRYSDARDVWGLLHNTQPTDYLIIKAQGSGPIYVGTDEDGNHLFSVNLILKIVE